VNVSIIDVAHAPELIPHVVRLVSALTDEICDACGDDRHFARDATAALELCRRWVQEGAYQPLLALDAGYPVGVCTLAETYALYAGGRVGVIQEFYVAPSHRSRQVGRRMLHSAFAVMKTRGWACLELCTPPLPMFERTIDFYERHGFSPVGGRKMRCMAAQARLPL
jgi:GNAT superfamily N-acetyltransferase